MIATKIGLHSGDQTTILPSKHHIFHRQIPGQYDIIFNSFQSQVEPATKSTTWQGVAYNFSDAPIKHRIFRAVFEPVTLNAKPGVIRIFSRSK